MTRKPIAIASLVLCLAAITQARSPFNLDVVQRDGYGVVLMKHPSPNELLIRATINEQPVTLILDTGWSAPGNGLALDRDLARALKLETKSVEPGRTWTGAKIGTSVAMGRSIAMGNVRITDVPLSFGDLAGLRTAVLIGDTMRSTGARGLISNGFLRATSAIIDLPNLKLYLRPPGTGRRALLGPALKDMAEAPLGRAGQHFVVDAEVNGVATKMVVDTGAYLTMLNSNFAMRAKANLNTRGRSLDATGVAKDAWLAGVRSFKIGGVPVYAGQISVTDTVLGSSEIAGLIGMDLLGQNWGIIDCGGEKLYLGHVR
jgi:predicted aspartyl protease